MCPFQLSEAPHVDYEFSGSPLEGFKEQRLFWKEVYERLAEPKKSEEKDSKMDIGVVTTG